MRAEPWIANLLTLADGTRTTSELLATLTPTADPIEFARLTATMIFAGLLELDEFKLPVPRDNCPPNPTLNLGPSAASPTSILKTTGSS
jgi:hypothetical protein